MAKRIDPAGAATSTLGGGLSSQIRNADPDRRYVGVWVRDERAMDTYMAAGYEPELLQDGGPAWARQRGAKPGCEQVYNGMLLMSMPNDAYTAIEREGIPDISAGLNEADRVERAMKRGNGGFNPTKDVEGGGRLVKARAYQDNPRGDVVYDG